MFFQLFRVNMVGDFANNFGSYVLLSEVNGLCFHFIILIIINDCNILLGNKHLFFSLDLFSITIYLSPLQNQTFSVSSLLSRSSAVGRGFCSAWVNFPL